MGSRLHVVGKLRLCYVRGKPGLLLSQLTLIHSFKKSRLIEFQLFRDQ